MTVIYLHTQEMISVGGVIKQQGKLLLVKQTYRGFPKGRIQSDDFEAVAREKIYTEIGIETLQLVQKLGHYQRPGPCSGEQKDIHLFLYTTNQEKITIHNDDIIDAQRIAIDEVSNYLVLPEDRSFFLRHLPAITDT